MRFEAESFSVIIMEAHKRNEGGDAAVKPIEIAEVQARIDRLKNRDVYLHLETSSGAYAAHLDSSKHPSSAFVSNAAVRFGHGGISGDGPYRIGLKTALGWVYAEGLTHYEENESELLLLAGHDSQGKLVTAVLLSPEPIHPNRGDMR